MNTGFVVVPIGDYHEGARPISSLHFGVIQTGFNEFSGFKTQLAQFNSGLVRWPGGTLSERKTDVYGLEIPGLFDASELYNYNPNRQRPTLTDMLGFAASEGMALSLIIPTDRYAQDIEKGKSHLEGFLHKLLDGEYGRLPRKLILEIGNEYKFLDSFKDNPGLYGKISAEFISTISGVLDAHSENSNEIFVAVQMGYSKGDNDAIIGQFTGESIREIDALVFHSLPISLNNLNRIDLPGDSEDMGLTRAQRAAGYAASWNSAIADAGGEEAELFLSAHTVGGSFSSAEGVDLRWYDYGIRGASVLLDAFAQYTGIGVDMAAAWGVDVYNLNAFSHMIDGEVVLRHTGVMLKAMSEVLPGMTLLDDFRPHQRSDSTMSWNFGSGSKYVSYIGVNDISGAETRSVTYLDVQNFRLISARRLGYELDGSFNGGLEDVKSILYQLPKWEDLGNIFSDDGLNISFSQDFQIAEIVMVVGSGLSGSPGDDWIKGGAASDKIIGAAGDDYLQGGLGDDTISGWSGHDSIFGGMANDLLYGNRGNDLLIGGGGRDALFGGEGSDTIIGDEGGDLIEGHSGDDAVFAGNGDDKIMGGVGNDTLNGDNENDIVLGGDGSDLLTGGRGDDVIKGQNDDDILFGWLGLDTMNGGNGNDTLIGEEDSDLLDGWDGDDELFGGQGWDTLIGGDGNDYLSADGEDDRLFGGDGNDTIAGGRGNDFAHGEDQDDYVFGWFGNDTLEGGLGDDTIFGEEDNDTVSGGEGSDLLVGGTGSDFIVGWLGDDTLDGGAGNDFLNGEFGNDVFIFFDGHGDDTIEGFEATNDLEYIALIGMEELGSFDDLIDNHIKQEDGGVVIYTGSGTITIIGALIQDLTDGDDFVFW